MIPFIIVFVVLSLDQITKVLVSLNLELNETFPLIKGVVGITLVHNRGAAFGVFKGQTYLFIFTSIAAIVLIYFLLKKNRKDNYYIFCLSLILAGATGNLIDRLRFGYVIDFLNFYIWPVFNIADSAITLGGLLLAWAIFRGRE